MRRAYGWSLVFSACVVSAACDDVDDNNFESASLSGDLTALDVGLTTVEDTPVSGVVRVADARGTVRATVVQPGAHGTVAIGLGTTFTYSPASNYVGTDAVIIEVTDGVNIRRATASITITAVNDPPALAGDTVLLMEEDSALRIDADTVVPVDPDNDVAGLTVTLVSGGRAYDVTDNALRPPLDFVGELTAYVMLSDGTASTVVPIEIMVTPVNDAPVNTVPEPQRTDEDIPFVFAGSARISIADVDIGDSALTVTLTANVGTVSLATVDGLTFLTGDGVDDASLSFSGTLSAVNAALDGLTVTPPSGFDGLITITLTTDDGGATGSGGTLGATDNVILGVGAVDLPPFNTLPGAASVDEDTTLTFVAGTTNEISVNDVDLTGSDIVSVDLVASSGTLNLAGTVGLTMTTGSGIGDATLEFSGSIDAINTALDGLRFVPSIDFAGAATLQLTTTSNALTDTDVVNITVRQVNDSPSIAAPTTVSIADSAPYALVDAEAVVIGDVDAASGTMRIELVGVHGGAAFASTAGVTMVTNTATQFFADGTLTALSALLTGLSFDPDDAYVGAASLQITIRDNGNTGLGGQASASATIDFTVFDDNTAPTALPDTYATSGNTLLTVSAANGVIANDTDADGTIAGVAAETIATTRGGTVTLAADGSFTYLPPVGDGNATTPVADGFSYTVADNEGATSIGTVTLNIGRVIWYVDDDATASDGRSSSPFTTLMAAIAEAEEQSIIYVADGSYSGSVTIPAGVQLVGSGVGFDRGPNDPLSAGQAPTIAGTSTAVITLGSGSAVRGVRIAPASDPGYPGIVINEADGATIEGVEVRKHAPGIQITQTTGTVSISASTIADTAGDAVSIARTSSGTTSVTFNNIDLEATRFGNGVLARASGAGTISISATALHVTAIDTNGVDVASIGNGSTVNIDITASTFDNDTTTALGDTAVRIVASESGALATFAITNSEFDAWPGSAVSVEADDGGTTVRGLVGDNSIDSTVPSTYQAAAIAVLLDHDAASGVTTGLVEITNNTVNLDGNSGPGILLRTRDGTSDSLDATVQSNVIAQLNSEAFTFLTDGGANICLELASNTAGTSGTANAYSLTSTPGSIRLPGLTGGGQAYVSSRNTGTPVVFTGTAIGGSSCQTYP